ncbi:nitrous oxide reductase accessory protein NosL [Danxiaibacter flavus]|uniref:Nitrous oxide reductase accessory protein NosL n=1 Tax=Danxiaibacter flavus TaxID=3049108 RepID=A0ABV3ZBF6_9BACT|nr:nitrous oxide reductase accessory protein NosL [Chitinophagaceae bacterium DXS]
MKQHIKKWVRVLLILSAIALAGALFTPIWSIDLDAPQYPEGLTLYIHAGKLAGDVDIVNGLNHYIGMKTLHANDFIEFTVLPYILVFFSVLLLITAIAGKRKLLYTTSALFILFCLVAMVDFWRWEYNYGHNLDDNAAIKVPGMAYQPPLLGYKQLLNFAAYSFPATGGFLIFITALVLCISCFFEYKAARITKNSRLAGSIAVLFIISIFASSCSAQPQPINAGRDQCSFCKMNISDPKFASEIISKKGRVFKFDDTHCIMSFLKKKSLDSADVKAIYFTDFYSPGQLLPKDEMFFYKSDKFNSPMNGNIVAFKRTQDIKHVQEQFEGEKIEWSGLERAATEP